MIALGIISILFLTFFLFGVASELDNRDLGAAFLTLVGFGLPLYYIINDVVSKFIQ